MKRLFLLFALSIPLLVLAQIEPLTNKDLEQTKVTKKEVRALYLQRSRRLSEGEAVTLFQLPSNHKLHKAFVREVLDMSMEKYLQETDHLVNAGLATSIFLVKSREEMIDKVSSIRNAIGYIDSDYLIVNTDIHGIKILKIVD